MTTQSTTLGIFNVNFQFSSPFHGATPAFGNEIERMEMEEVKETVASNAPAIRQKTNFSTADLWDVQRRRHIRSVRTYATVSF